MRANPCQVGEVVGSLSSSMQLEEAWSEMQMEEMRPYSLEDRIHIRIRKIGVPVTRFS